MSSASATLDEAITLAERVRAEFNESPGLSLTPSQAQRLFDLDPSCGAATLSRLCDCGFLIRDKEGRFRRRDT